MDNLGYINYDFFSYEADFSALAASASATQSFTIQAEADFILSKIAFLADIAAAAQTDSSRVIPLVSMLITDTGSGRNLMANAVPIASLAGNGQLPFVLPRQRIFRARSQVQVTLTNFSAATDYNVKITFIGEKAFIKTGG